MNEPHARTLNDVRKSAGELTSMRGLAALLNVLDTYKATRICEVPEQHYTDFIERCNSIKSEQG